MIIPDANGGMLLVPRHPTMSLTPIPLAIPITSGSPGFDVFGFEGDKDFGNGVRRYRGMDIGGR